MNDKLTKEQIKKFYLGPLTKFVGIPLTVATAAGVTYYLVKGDSEGIIAGVIFFGCSVAATVLSYLNDLRRNKQ